MGFIQRVVGHGVACEKDDASQEKIANDYQSSIYEESTDEMSEELHVISPGSYESAQFRALNEFDPGNKYSIYNAAGCGKDEIIPYLLKSSLPIGDPSGKTPLMVAAAFNHTKCITELLKVLDPKDVDKNGRDALGWALGNPDVAQETLDILIPLSNLKSSDSTGKTALMAAAAISHVKGIEMLLDGGSDPKWKDKNGRDALSWALDNHRIAREALDVLIPLSDFDTKGSTGKTALMAAASLNHVECIKRLLGRGGDPKVQDKNGRDALNWALGNPDVAQETLDILIPLSNLKACDSTGGTSLMAAAAINHAKAIEMLLEGDVDPKAQDDNGRDALNWALGNPAVTQNTLNILISRSDLKARDRAGLTALAKAMQHNIFCVVEALAVDLDTTQTFPYAISKDSEIQLLAWELGVKHRAWEAVDALGSLPSSESWRKEVLRVAGDHFSFPRIRSRIEKNDLLKEITPPPLSVMFKTFRGVIVHAVFFGKSVRNFFYKQAEPRAPIVLPAPKKVGGGKTKRL